MKWTEPKLYDLSDLKNSVAQGACATGSDYGGETCVDGQFADPGGCANGVTVGIVGCTAGSAPTLG